LSLGCDFHLSFENLERVLEQPHTYTIGETNYLLIELSNYSVPAQLGDCFFRLGSRGLTPILTHPERKRRSAYWSGRSRDVWSKSRPHR
jgi:protein-tyrosine phosphatase